MKEIGGEFWQEHFLVDELTMNVDDNSAELASGRTALDFIIKDIKSFKKVKKAYLPSYCCDTMIKPFINNQIEVIFYDVIYDENLGELQFCIDTNMKCDIFYQIEYFGYTHNADKETSTDFKNRGTIVINDQTHSIFTDGSVCKQSADYSYSSFRKWFFSPGYAIAHKAAGKFNNVPTVIKKDYAKLRIEASELKKSYIHKGEGDKEKYLNIYKLADDLLENDYVGYAADNYSKEIVRHYDYDNLKQVRRKNAEFLLEHLKEIKGIVPIFNDLKQYDCPLFVPVLIDKDKRNLIHDKLILNHIYCPIHWPIPIDVHDTSIYDRELSLLCDQRYTFDEMERICNILKQAM